MADVRPFRALRYNAAAVDPATAIAPPYDVISPAMQRELYQRSEHNIVRVEYGEQRTSDTPSDNRYTRARDAIAAWRNGGALTLDDAEALYAYEQTFTWEGGEKTRRALFCAVRIEPWDRGVVLPHEHTLSAPKADRLELLRHTRTQVSPVYGIVRGTLAESDGAPLYDYEADGQRHVVRRVEAGAVEAVREALRGERVYIADGHHRYETALAYRDEARATARGWTGEEPENFVLMALTAAGDPGLLVLPTHRMVHVAPPADARERLAERFTVEEIAGDGAVGALEARRQATAFVAAGIAPRKLLLLSAKPDGGIDGLMPDGQPDAWKRLDVNVLQYGILQDVFGIDDEALRAGGVVTYTQDAREALAAVKGGSVQAAFLLNATPVEQVMAIADAGARMPQKSTYFYPKLPTGLLLRPIG
jgi:uncharacterized protein (DUF1015 family)